MFCAYPLPGTTRERGWIDQFGPGPVPVIGPIPHPGSGPGSAHGLFYSVDLARMEAGRLGRICEAMARNFGLHPRAVRADIARHGLPIFAPFIRVVPESWAGYELIPCTVGVTFDPEGGARLDG